MGILYRSLVSEWLGTMFLLASVIGLGIMAENLAAGNMAIALLGNTIPTGVILVVLITIIGPISGAHFNPAVTIARSFTNTFSGIYPGHAVGFVFAQLAAAVIGAYALKWLFAPTR